MPYRDSTTFEPPTLFQRTSSFPFRPSRTSSIIWTASLPWRKWASSSRAPPHRVKALRCRTESPSQRLRFVHVPMLLTLLRRIHIFRIAIAFGNGEEQLPCSRHLLRNRRSRLPATRTDVWEKLGFGAHLRVFFVLLIVEDSLVLGLCRRRTRSRSRQPGCPSFVGGSVFPRGDPRSPTCSKNTSLSRSSLEIPSMA